MSRLHVVTAITNPVRYRSRPALYREFVRHVTAHQGVTLWTAEAAFGNRDFEVTEEGHPNHLRLRTRSEVWHKENLLNLLIEQLPKDGAPVAWVDADVHFTRPNWVQETLEQLEHYDVVQMFEECQDLDSDYNVVPNSRMRSMVASWQDGEPMIPSKLSSGYCRTAGHCGYAWAIRRDALRRLGGKLIDFAIVGSADYQMACAFMGRIEETIPPGVHESYARAIRAFGHRARLLQRNIGYVPGLLLHNWHGKKSDRGYLWRNKILTEHKFNPETDLDFDEQGMLRLNMDGTDRMLDMRDSLRQYFRSRNEDVPSV